MKASEIPIGSGFVGSIFRSDWNDHWRAGKPMPGDLIYVDVIVPVASRGDDYLKALLKLHACHLHADSSSQLSTKDAFWVCGVRETRSKNVYVFEWRSRAIQTHLERVHELLKSGVDDHARTAMAELDALAEREVPYL
ncbi:MAG: hypothetical protein ABL974_15085 [Prosthecobacter sp.]